MRTGFTTGACAAAAARAATERLVSKQIFHHVECLLPNGQQVHFPVTGSHHQGDHVRAVVIKDAGDDPDRTHGAHLTADVCLLPDAPGQVRIKGGGGVGTVTMPGLGLKVGGPAINPVPRRNIEDNVRLAAASLLEQQGLEVIISVPGGQEMAQKTLNARLGILGGISILGTTGIVHPWSTAAFRTTVIQGIEVAATQGQNTVVLTTGGRTEKFAMKELSNLPSVCFVQMGDFLGYALDTIVEQGIDHVVIGGMVGKLAKMAQGETITHAGRNAVDMDLVADIATAVKVPTTICNRIRMAQTARYAAERVEELGLTQVFHKALAQRVIETLSKRYPGKFTLRILVCDFDGNKIAEA